ncbi:von Willebrand factor A domain-containing protein 5A [Sciurus carolinensis]|uniref:von Willebrand factor A domain-containing protein 5A n=1 Tax=Sciurus carolinensis TaxID=30640 RepID=A0AA41MVI4_SCICA|nr:von Willebrand factor A domain-containing protein 5A [Sciurus carolinensis]
MAAATCNQTCRYCHSELPGNSRQLALHWRSVSNQFADRCRTIVHGISMEGCCDLITLQKEPVALKSISVTLSIHEFVAGVSATLNYENEEKVPLEASIVFPMDEDSAVYSFDALVCLDMKTPVVPLDELPYTLSMVPTIRSQHGIQKVHSNCPLSAVEFLADDKTSAQVSLAEGQKFNRDVEPLIYYSEVHSPRVSVEMGMPEKKLGSLMGDPSVIVSFYPDIPEGEASVTCGEYVFLMDCSGSMQCPMNNQDRSQSRIEAAKLFVSTDGEVAETFTVIKEV